ncbi:hypothetical protein [Microvirga brassicacearum]|uniref:Uncharacterized protein n=1 Tax=Microvirga brassicacearum TaxID=2580413 RepID=A0A5N3PH67_9HYPH|nr:hypothetical protein [Microvirga brassicacearum]KAB0269086.1 hypothetical protein FEZ63_02965 [Microvirga brassicacearum]
MTGTTRTIKGLPIYWTDDVWVTHSCVRAEAVPGVFLVWTDCGRDVPPNAAKTAEPGDSVSCAKCLAAANVRW